MSKRILVGTGWLLVLLGVCGHIRHKWLRENAPGASWFAGDNGTVSAYVREHVIWWGLIVVGAIVVFVCSRKTEQDEV